MEQITDTFVSRIPFTWPKVWMEAWEHWPSAMFVAMSGPPKLAFGAFMIALPWTREIPLGVCEGPGSIVTRLFWPLDGAHGRMAKIWRKAPISLKTEAQTLHREIGNEGAVFQAADLVGWRV